MSKLKNYRTEAKLSQQQLADAVGLSSAYISQIECGKRKMSVKTAKKLALKFGIEWPIFFKEERT